MELSENLRITNGANISYPPIDLEIDEEGNIYCAWTYYFYPDDTIADIFLRKSTDSGSSFQNEIRINDIITGSQGGIEFEIGQNGELFAVWSDSRSGKPELYFSKSTDEGQTFSTSINIDDEILFQPVRTPSLKSNNNYIYVSFKSQSGDIYLVVSNDYGDTFGLPTKLREMTGFWMDVDSEGNLYFIYYIHSEDAYCIKSTDHGNTFSQPVRINPPEQLPHHIGFTTDHENNIHVTWVDAVSEFTFYTKSKDGGETFHEAIQIEDHPNSDIGSNPVIGTDDYGGVYIVYSDNYNGDSDVFLCYSNDGGNSFSKRIRVNDDTGTTIQRDPALCNDGLGNLFIAWMDGRDGINQVYFSKAPAINHAPVTKGSFPVSIKYFEDQSSGELLVDVTYYFEDPDGPVDLRYVVFDELNETNFQPIITDGEMGFNQLVPDIFGTFGFSIMAYDEGDDGIPNNSDDLGSDPISFYLIVNPTDDAPIITGLGDLIEEDGSFNIDVNEDTWFNSTFEYEEYDHDTCIFECTDENYPFELDGVSGNISFKPGNEYVGYHNYTIRVEDGNGSYDEVKLSFHVINVNDPPTSIKRSRELELDEDESCLGLDISSWFEDIDSYPLSIKLTGTVEISALYNPNNTIDIVPPADWFGKETLRLTASDGEYSDYSEIIISVSAVNDAPDALNITLLEEKYVEGKSQKVRGTAEDVDDTQLFFTWYEGTEQLGTGEEINLGLGPGTHDIRLIVTDPNGATNEATVSIDVEESESASFGFIIAIIIVIFILLLVIIGVVIMLILRKRSGPNESDIDAPISTMNKESFNSYENPPR